METNIRKNHGPLGALYPPKTWTAPNPHSAIKEGDTPSWFYFLPLTFNDPDTPEWGGWGGRFQRFNDQIYVDAQDSVSGTRSARATVWRWRKAFQNDFQARMDWCVAPNRDLANHNPLAVLNGDISGQIIKIDARSSETVRLSASGSKDPDGDQLQFRWFVYSEAGTNSEQPTFSSPESLNTTLRLPEVSQTEKIHIILETRDDGEPSLYSFRRAVVTVNPIFRGR
jgi:hypothetical protein